MNGILHGKKFNRGQFDWSLIEEKLVVLLCWWDNTNFFNKSIDTWVTSGLNIKQKHSLSKVLCKEKAVIFQRDFDYRYQTSLSHTFVKFIYINLVSWESHMCKISNTLARWLQDVDKVTKFRDNFQNHPKVFEFVISPRWPNLN